MSNAASINSPMLNSLASRIISEVGTFFANVSVSPSYSIDEFPYEKGRNYIYVLYSGNGMPLHAGVMLESTGKRDQNKLVKEIQGFGFSGYVESFRVLELGSEDLARQLERLVQELFRGALPLKTNVQLAAPEVEQSEQMAAITTPAPAKRRRGRPRKSTEETDVPIKRRPGRPKKSETAEAPATPRRRGRPRKNAEAETASTEAPTRRRGRPRKNEAADETPAKRRRGRPKKSETTGTATPARKRGRPRKDAATETEGKPAAAKRRGRPRKEGEAAPAEATKGGKRRGRPAKGATAATKRGAGKRGGKSATPSAPSESSTSPETGAE